MATFKTRRTPPSATYRDYAIKAHITSYIAYFYSPHLSLAESAFCVACLLCAVMPAIPARADVQQTQSEASGKPGRQKGYPPDIAQLRKVIESQQRGAPDYEDMEPGMAAVAAGQAKKFQIGLSRLGRLESIAFLRQSRDENIYEVWFSNGRMIWGICNSPRGKISRIRAILREHR